MELSVKPSVRKAIENIHCGNCQLASSCWPAGLPAELVDHIDRLIIRNPPLHAGATLYGSGSPCGWVYTVRAGALKTVTRLPSGEEHISCIQVAGDMVGIDDLGVSNHSSEAVALETSMLCAMPTRALFELTKLSVGLQQHMLCVLSARIRQAHERMATLTHMTAEQKLASFLVRLSDQHHARGLSGQQLRLPISRSELANYLGLAPETISRLLARLQQQSIVVMDRREVTIVDTRRLTATFEDEDEPTVDTMPCPPPDCARLAGRIPVLDQERV